MSRHEVTWDVASIPASVKEAVLSVAPGAEIILFGSRARGDHADDSDWDFLVLLEDEQLAAKEEFVRDAIFELQLLGMPINCMIESRKFWNSERLRATPFHKNVSHEGVAV